MFGDGTMTAYNMYKSGSSTLSNLVVDKFGADKINEYQSYKKKEQKQWTKDQLAEFAGIEAYETQLQSAFDKIDQFYTEYENKRNAIFSQMESEHNLEMLDDDITRFEEFVDGILQAEQQYQETLAQIRSEYGMREDANIGASDNEKAKQDLAVANEIRTQARNQVAMKTGIKLEAVNLDEFAASLEGLASRVAYMTRVQIKEQYDNLIKDIQSESDKVDLNIVHIEGLPQLRKDLAQVNEDLRNQNLTEEEKTALLKRQNDLKNQLVEYGDEEAINERKAYINAEIERLKGEIAKEKAGKHWSSQDPNKIENYEEQIDVYQNEYNALAITDETQLNDLYAQRNALYNLLLNVQTKLGAAVSNTNKRSLEEAKKIQSQWRVSIQSLELAKQSIDEVAHALSSTMGDAGKKAVETMSGILDAGIGGVQSIENLFNTVTQGFTMTTAAAVKSMSSLEKASFILTILSIAVQVISKLAEVFSKFTPAAMMQEQIDKHLEQVERLKRATKDLKREYEDKTGVDYYLGMAKQAKSYNDILAKQNQALEDALALRRMYINTESEKYKDADQQVLDIQDDIDSTMQEQKDAIAQLLEELATTNLFSFSESLADAVVDGFSEGMGGVEEVFEDTLDNLYRAMLTKQLSMAFEKQFQGVFEEIEKRTTDENNAFDQDDIDYIMDLMDKASEGAEAIAESYYHIFAERGLLDDADTEASQGFGQMTQDQADTLTARFTAVQIEMSNVSAATRVMAEVVTGVGEDIKSGLASIQSLLYNSNIALQIAQDQLDHLQVIAENTAMLAETNTRLKAIEQNTDRL